MQNKTSLAVVIAAVLMALPSLPADTRSLVVIAHPGAHPAAVLPDLRT